jgi:hypothetical protein
LRKPPIPAPVCSPACSVASPISQARGMSAHADRTKSTTSPAPTTQFRMKTTGASASEAHKRFRATGSPLYPRSPGFVKSCAAPLRPSKLVHAGRSRRGAGQAPTSSAGRGRVPEVRRFTATRSSTREPASSATVPSCTRTRTTERHSSGACRRCSTSRSTSGCCVRRRRSSAASGQSAPAAVRCRCATSRSDPCYQGREDEIGCINPEFYEVPAGRPSFRVFAQVRR